MTEQYFDDNFTLVPNHLDDNAGWNGSMFETYGPEEEYVRQIALSGKKRVWTIIEGDNDTMYLVTGRLLVNRIGYLITEEEYTEECEIKLEK